MTSRDSGVSFLQIRSACGVAVSSLANWLAVTQLGVCSVAGRQRRENDGTVV